MFDLGQLEMGDLLGILLRKCTIEDKAYARKTLVGLWNQSSIRTTELTIDIRVLTQLEVWPTGTRAPKRRDDCDNHNPFSQKKK